PAVAMVSERFVRSHAAAGVSPVGGMLRIDGAPTLIVGVVPAVGELPVGADLWRPLVIGAGAARDERAFQGVAPLRDGGAVAAAREERRGMGRGEARRFPATDAELTTDVRTISAGILDPISPMFQKVACAAVLLTLLVVAANLAGLQLARGAARRREW